MGKVKVTELLDAGNDVLVVRGKIGKQDVVAYGWVSALSHHYPEAAYDDDGALRLGKGRASRGGEAPALDPEHEPRAMTKDERRAYAERLLREQNQEPTPIAL